MNLRKYSIYFHTHTISGIIICALLYIIFFAGSFSFFKEEIAAWQKDKSQTAFSAERNRDYNYVLDSLAGKHNLLGRDINFSFPRAGAAGYVYMSTSHDSLVSKPQPVEQQRGRRGRNNPDAENFSFDFTQKTASDYSQSYDMGEFLYRLHFLAQLNQIPIHLGAPFGYLLAGIVSFLFLFALITGFFLHYEKIKSNFFVFRPFSKWKTVWTDLHTAIGIIGFPFQLIFAVTGVILIANFALFTPYAQILYKGDADQLYTDLQYSDAETFDYLNKPLGKDFDVNGIVKNIAMKWEGADITQVSIRNYGDANMHILLQGKPQSSERFAGSGKLVYQVQGGKVLYEKSPIHDANYIDQVKALIYRLHFGDFGGKPLRVIFFILGLMGCVVIISGILIWLVARDKKSVPAYKRKFNFWTANIFLATCLSMLPVTAFTFVMVKVVEQPDQTFIYNCYFYTWLVLGLYFVALRNIELTNRQTLLLSTATCLLVPLANGLYVGKWLWVSFQNQELDILFIDLLFIALALGSYFVYLKVLAQQRLKQDID